MSAAGVGDAYAKLNGLMKFFISSSNVGVAYRDLAVTEDLLRASRLDWIACRPTALNNGSLKGIVREIVGGAFPLSATISRADVAGWMLERVTRADAPSEGLSCRWPTITAG